MFELVRKPCSLNFGSMLGLFGMIGMTLLLAAVCAFGIQGNDGQFDAYGREWCTKGARAEWHADGAGEESGAPSVPEQSGTPMVPEESGTTSVPEGAGVSTVPDVGTASVPEGAGVAVGQERSESEADSVLGHSPSYADQDHVQGSGNTSEHTIPRTGEVQPVPSRSGSTGRRYCFSFDPGQDCRRRGVGEVAGGSRYSVRSCISASRYSVRACISACGVWRTGSRNDPGKAYRVGRIYSCRLCLFQARQKKRLLRQLFMKEQERRVQEALSLGIPSQGSRGEGEPLPLLSHLHGRPSNVEDMYDSLSQALTIRDRSFSTRVSLGQGASSRYVAWEAPSERVWFEQVGAPRRDVGADPVPTEAACVARTRAASEAYGRCVYDNRQRCRPMVQGAFWIQGPYPSALRLLFSNALRAPPRPTKQNPGSTSQPAWLFVCNGW